MSTASLSAAHLTVLTAALADRYRLEREIGAGGMAIVWHARDLRHDREVAIKILHPELSAVLGPERFLSEIRTTANLQYPHILPLFDSGSADGLLYYVMPYVDGETLRGRLERERQLSVAEAVRLAGEVAGALDYAHRRGVVHRDIKPENILLQDGHALVADFGIALAVSTAGGARITQTGLSLGTPQYMSPEQATADRAIDGRTDIYSLGAVLYEMLTGDPPHTGSTAQAIIARVLVDEPRSVRASRRAVPAPVDAAVQRALAKLPADRFATAQEFATALTTARDGSVAAADQATVFQRRLGRATTLAAIAVLVVALAQLLRRGGGDGTTSGGGSTAVASRQLTFAGTAESPVFSPDGRRVAYVEQRCTGESATACMQVLRVQDLGSGQAADLATASVIVFPEWSPDGAWILAFMLLTGGEPGLYVTPSLGGAPRRLAPLAHAAFAATGDTILIAELVGPGATRYLRRVRASTGEVLDSAALSVDGRFTAMVPSPDGRRFAFRHGSQLILGTRDGQVTDSVAFEYVGDLRWDPDGGALYAFRPGIGIDDWLLRVRLDRTRERFVEGVDTILSVRTVGARTFDISRDGRTLAHTGGTTTTVLWAVDLDADPVTPRRLAASTSWLGESHLSSDGELVAYSATDLVGDNVYVIPFAGGASKAVTQDSGQLSPRGWIPGTHQVTYSAGGQGAPVYAQSVPQGVPQGARREIGRLGSVPLADGSAVEVVGMPRRLLFRAADGSERTIAVPDSLGGNVSLFSAEPAAAYVRAISMAPARHTLYRIDRETGAITELVAMSMAGAPMPVGAWDGWLVYATYPVNEGDGARPTIWRVSSGHPATRVAELPLQCDRATLDMSADGRRFVCTHSSRSPDIFLLERFDRYRR